MEIFVVGVGYVGLTSAVGLAELGHRVVAHDIDAGRVQRLRDGHSPIFEAGMEAAIREQAAAGRLSFSLDPTPPDATQVAVVCVPTPTAADGLLRLDTVEAVTSRLLATLAPSATIVVRSTLPLHGPARLAGLRSGLDRTDRADPADRTEGSWADGPAIVVNPEFMREGRALEDFRRPSRIVVGAVEPRDERAAAGVAALYADLGAPVVLSDAASVVLGKLASNVFLGMKIAFANELGRLADAIGADIAPVVDGIGQDPRIGRAFLDAGPGFGGSCLPEQAAAIAVEASQRDVDVPLLGTIATSNQRHQDAIVDAVEALLGRGLDGARVAVLGLAFKANTDDVRFSPALALVARLRERGASVVGHDPIANGTATAADPHLETAATPEAASDAADAVVVATEWPVFATLDWARVAPRMRGDLVYDTRRCLDGDAVRAAGLRYVGLGRAVVTKEPAASPR